MAEPLTVFGAVVGGIEAADKVCKLVDLFWRVADAPKEMRGIQEELTAISRILKSLEPFILKDGGDLSNDASSISAEDLCLVATDLTNSMSSLNGILTGIASHRGFKGSTVVKNSLWVKNERTVKQEINRLQCQKSSLVAMLALLERYGQIFGHEAEFVNIYARARRDEITHVVRENCYQMEQLRSELRDAIARVEKNSPETVRLTKDYNRSRMSTSSFANPNAQNANQAFRLSKFQPGSSGWQDDCKAELHAFSTSARPSLQSGDNEDIHKILSTTVPYRRAERNMSRFSTESHGSVSFGLPLTCLSEISLSEVSNISVLHLPIIMAQLSNKECYVGMQNNSSEEMRATESPLKVSRRVWEKVTSISVNLGLIRDDRDPFAGGEKVLVRVDFKGCVRGLIGGQQSLYGYIPACIAFSCAALRTGNETDFTAPLNEDIPITHLCQDIQQDLRQVLERKAWHIAFEQDKSGKLVFGRHGIASMLKAILSAMGKPLISGRAYELFHDETIWDTDWVSDSSEPLVVHHMTLCASILSQMDREELLILLFCLGLLNELICRTNRPAKKTLKLATMFRPLVLSRKDSSAAQAQTLEQDSNITNFLLRNINNIIDIPNPLSNFFHRRSSIDSRERDRKKHGKPFAYCLSQIED